MTLLTLSLLFFVIVISLLTVLVNPICVHVSSKTLTCWNSPNFTFHNHSQSSSHHILSFSNITFVNPHQFCDFLPKKVRIVILTNSHPKHILCPQLLGCHRKRKYVKIVRGCEEHMNRYSPWTSWNFCSVSCGDNGYQIRNRSCRHSCNTNHKIQRRICNNISCGNTCVINRFCPFFFLFQLLIRIGLHGLLVMQVVIDR